MEDQNWPNTTPTAQSQWVAWRGDAAAWYAANGMGDDGSEVGDNQMPDQDGRSSDDVVQNGDSNGDDPGQSDSDNDVGEGGMDGDNDESSASEDNYQPSSDEQSDSESDDSGDEDEDLQGEIRDLRRSTISALPPLPASYSTEVLAAGSKRKRQSSGEEENRAKNQRTTNQTVQGMQAIAQAIGPEQAPPSPPSFRTQVLAQAMTAPPTLQTRRHRNNLAVSVTPPPSYDSIANTNAGVPNPEAVQGYENTFISPAQQAQDATKDEEALTPPVSASDTAESKTKE